MSQSTEALNDDANDRPAEASSENSDEMPVKPRISLPPYILICLFGIGSWLAINGIWMELPILVNHAPEKWSLPSYLTVITELANIGPLIYVVGNKLAPKKVHERTAVYTLIILGSVACFLLAFYWDKTSFIFGAERSTALMVLSFFVALVDCTSTIVFLPFMAMFPVVYISALFTGENMSGLLPSFFALIQGVDKRKTVTKHSCINTTCFNTTSTVFTHLNFNPDYFFVFLSLMMLVCGGAFLAINFLPFMKKIHVMDYKNLCEFKNSSRREKRQRVFRDISSEPLLVTDSAVIESGHGFGSDVSMQTFAGDLKTRICGNKFCKRGNKSFLYFLFLLAWVNCISNGAISQLQAFACEPYGPSAYHLAVTLSGLSSALICIVFMWLPSTSDTLISACSVVYTLLSSYLVILAAQSPNPVLKGTSIGSALLVTTFVLCGITVNYVKLAICTVLRERGHRDLFWGGVAIQVGSFIGAAIVFPLVNVAKLFKQ